ncbi:MAG: hypothetical protein COV44_09495 [Deltaproteobacteria bacterium CG11_big_fil_rev_8_21_14_0_20_45_16]|nr:MAG: hypothetical protein COV44_09495 [Deltaproteobacteria bacterium CG11_big_fil_rev_8_21_14_0_20_45_16]
MKGLPTGVNPFDTTSLRTDASSTEGLRIRSNLNYVLGARARSWLSDDPIAVDFRDYSESLLFGLMVSDALMAGGEVLGEALMFDLRQSLAFIRGMGNGAYDMAEGFGELAAMLYLDTGGTLSAIAKVFTEYDKTAAALNKFADEKWNDFKTASPEEQAEMIGRLTFEIESVILPVGEVFKSMQAPTRVAAVAGEVSKGVGSAAKQTIISGLSKLDRMSGGAGTYFMARSPQLLGEVVRSETALNWAQKTLMVSKEWAQGLPDIGLRLENYLKFEPRFESIRGVAGEATVYRGIPKGSDFPSHLTHPGSLKGYGQRFSHPGEPTVYTALKEDLVWKEIRSGVGIPSEYVMDSFPVKYSDALDLTDTAVLNQLGITAADVVGDNKLLTQVIGSMARERGFDSIIHYSSKGDGLNLVIFRDSIGRTIP